MTGQLGLLPPTANEIRAEETDTGERSDDPTPRGVIRSVLFAFFVFYLNGVCKFRDADGRLVDVQFRDLAERVSADRPLRILDVCAGHGAWAMEFARAWVAIGLPREWIHITGVELHAPREPDLRKWCDEVIIRDYFDALRDHHVLPEFDLIIGNPHFPALTGALTPGDMFGEHTSSMPEALLVHAPAVLLLHTQQAFLKSEAGRAAWRRCPPAACWLVPGSVKFRRGVNPKCPKCKTVNPVQLDGDECPVTYCVKGCGAKLKAWGADSRCYQVSLWLRGHEGPTSTHLLPELTAAERQWVVPPGSEQPSADLPAAPGWTPTET